MNKNILFILLGVVVGVLVTATLMAPSGNLGAVVVHNASEGFDGGLSIGLNGSLIAKHLTATASYNPPSLTWQSIATTTVTLTGAVAGDPCSVGFSSLNARGGMNVTCQIQTADTALVSIVNLASTTTDNVTGTLRASVWQY